MQSLSITGKSWFVWQRTEATTWQKFFLALAMAGLTGLASQIWIALPFTPVPVTGQTFAVLLSGILLGGRFGALSQILYVAIGGLGVPWFSGLTGGLAVLAGPTSGYFLGFVMTAFIIGLVAERHSEIKKIHLLFPFLLACNFVFIFLPGLVGLAFWFGLLQGQWPTLNQILLMGFYPFIPGAIFKTALAAGLACRILPKK